MNKAELNQLSLNDEGAARTAAFIADRHMNPALLAEKFGGIALDPQDQGKMQREAKWHRQRADDDAYMALEALSTLKELSDPNREIPQPHKPKGVDLDEITKRPPGRPLGPADYGGGE
jgi:hypothetical protein